MNRHPNTPPRAALLVVTLGATWLASPAHAQYDTARVLSSTPVYQQVANPREVCRRGSRMHCPSFPRPGTRNLNRQVSVKIPMTCPEVEGSAIRYCLRQRAIAARVHKRFPNLAGALLRLTTHSFKPNLPRTLRACASFRGPHSCGAGLYLKLRFKLGRFSDLWKSELYC